MCGIFASVYSPLSQEELEKYFLKLGHRGPDMHRFEKVDQDVFFGFHRLAVVHPGKGADQPIVDKERRRVLVCNGEIYNYQQLTTVSENESDCVCIMNLFRQMSPLDALQKLNAEYAFIYYDRYRRQLLFARDPFGIRPLFFGRAGRELYLASELKGIPSHCVTVEQVQPNILYTYDLHYCRMVQQGPIFPLTQAVLTSIPSEQEVFSCIRSLLTEAVRVRMQADRPIGCLLSGGLDSSLIVSLAARLNPDIHTFSIGLEGSYDLIAARKVVEFLGLKNHHEVVFKKEEAIACIPQLIQQLETYDVTTIRASLPQYLLARYIRENTDVVALLSGEGADELFAGYQYSKNAPDEQALLEDTRRLLSELYLFDNLRSDRTMAAYGLELRLPFLDTNLVSYVLSIPSSYRMPSTYNGREKDILRRAFAEPEPALPDEILYRRKDAFSDAVSSPKETWIEYLKSNYNEREDYKRIFLDYYPGRASVLPHQWMPRWCDATDPSATVLGCFQRSE